jgi:tRNA modification GTPase
LPTVFDTIVAPITGTQPAAVAIVRLSGAESWEIAKRIFPHWPDVVESHRATYGWLRSGDDGLVLPFEEGRSYTGERSVEFSIHGAPASVRSLVDRCITEGARLAAPGEFTQRAFLNGRMDLIQAEAVRDTVEAQTEAQLRQANLHRDQALSRKLNAMRLRLEKMLTAVEASVDFSEEIGDFDRTAAASAITSELLTVEQMLATAPAGRILREGFRIALVGPPNAGKSSLLNALLGAERAIVTNIPGTTRDYVEERVEIGGVLCVLYDTAGLRSTEEIIETLGIERTLDIAGNVDEIWYIVDSTVGVTEEDRTVIRSFTRPVLVLSNKSDLASSAEGLSVSATTREGFEQLFNHVSQKVSGAAVTPLINRRHEHSLLLVKEALLNTLSTLHTDMPDDLLSVGLRDAVHHLGELTGEAAAPDLIQRIFHDFCIGK